MSPKVLSLMDALNRLIDAAETVEQAHTATYEQEAELALAILCAKRELRRPLKAPSVKK